MCTKPKKFAAMAHDGAAVDVLLKMAKGCNQLSGRSAGKEGGIKGVSNEVVHNSVPCLRSAASYVLEGFTQQSAAGFNSILFILIATCSQTFYYPGSHLRFDSGRSSPFSLICYH